MNDAKLERRLLEYFIFDPRSVFERTDENFFFVSDYRQVYERVSEYFFTFGSLPKTSSVHSIFEDKKLFSIAREILDNDAHDFDQSELEFLINRLGELKIARSLKPIVLEAVDEISAGHGFEALEVLENGTMGIARSMRRNGQESYDIDGDVKSSLFMRSDKMNEPDEMKALKIGFSGFDEFMGGIRGGQLITFCSPTGQGKSITLLNIGGHLYLHGYNVVYVLLEMERQEWEMRFDSWLTGIEFRKLYNKTLDKEERQQYRVVQIENLLQPSENEEFLEWFRKTGRYQLSKMKMREFAHEYMQSCKFRKNVYYPLDIPRNCTVERLEVRMNYVRQKWGVDALIVDYPGIMQYSQHGGDYHWKDLGELYRQLKGLARFYRIPVLVAAQLHDEEVGAMERMTSRWVRFSKEILDHTDLAFGWVMSMEDIRKNRLIMKTLKTRNCRHSFEIRCSADFDKMRVEESEFRLLE